MTRRLISLAAIYAIALQALLGAWAGALQAAPADRQAMVLCVSGAMAPSGDPAQPSAPHQADCCAVLCAGGFAVESGTAPIVAPVAIVAAQPTIEAHAAPVARRHVSAQPRGPPIAV